MNRRLLRTLFAPFLLTFSLLFFGIPPLLAQSTGTVTGTVVDATDGQPLIGANVALRDATSPEIVGGTATDTEGTFRLTNLPPGDYILAVRFVGYRSEERPLTLEAGTSRTFNIALQLSTASLETVVVSASRRQEKVLDAPASISVLGPQELEQGVSTSTVEKLRATPGVDMAQTGIDRREVVLRGFNDAFSGSAYVLTDYREAAVPSLGVNVHSIMPNLQVDVAQVEVVRGPGSALYGPGVDSGVVHYFTKDPFEYPGTTISVSGGQRGYFGAQFRQAGVVSERFGYKVTGQFARADEWDLDPSDPADAREIARYRVFDNPNDEQLDGKSFVTSDVDGDGNSEAQLRREDLYRKYNVNGLLQYRVNDETTLSLNGGLASLKGVVQSGIGTLQADGFGYTYGQLRLQSGGLFAQAYVNANDAGSDTYVYGTGSQVIDKGIQWNGQVQYDFGLESVATQFIVGADADIVTPRTEGQILGRNEGNDQIREYGLYTQSTTDLSEKFALTLAARGDYNNIVDDFQISPRAALVFKATPSNTFRASFNRSFSSPGTNSNFLDIEAQRQTIADVPNSDQTFDLVFQGLGAAGGYTFDTFRDTRQVRFILPTGTPGFDFKDRVPLSTYPVLPTYGATAQGFSARLQSGDEFGGTLGMLPDDALQDYAQLLGAIAQNTAPDKLTSDPSSENGVVLGIPDDSQLGYQAVESPTDIDPLQQTTTQTYELGYKGLLGERFVVQVDGYYERKEDFIGPLRIESPLAYLDPQFIAADILTKIQGNPQENPQYNPQVDGAFQQFLEASGLDQQEAIELLSGTFGSTASGIVQPDQEVLPVDNPTNVGGFLSYRNFGQVEYWGIDASVEFQASDALRMFSNVSFVSDDFFDNEELDETDTSLNLALNAPAFKAKGGLDYAFENGLSLGATGNYVEGFRVRSGPYVGDVETYFLLDLRAGYEVPSIPGLRLNVSAKNVLDNEHREFVGAPELGLTIFGSATYTLP